MDIIQLLIDALQHQQRMQKDSAVLRDIVADHRGGNQTCPFIPPIQTAEILSAEESARRHEAAERHEARRKEMEDQEAAAQYAYTRFTEAGRKQREGRG